MKYRPRHLTERYKTAEEAGDAAFWQSLRDVVGAVHTAEKTVDSPDPQSYEVHEAKP